MSAECVVYTARNLVNGKVYVGSTVSWPTRQTNHIRNLNRDCHGNEHIQQDWTKYGEANFVWEIVEKCPSKYRREREQWWIECLRSNVPEFGYNKSYPVRSVAPSERMTEVHKAYWSGLEGEERKVRLAHLTDPERNPKINSAKMTERLKDPVFKAKVLAGLTRARNENNVHPTKAQLEALTKARLNAIAKNKTPEARAKQRQNNLDQFKDPVIRANRLEALARGRQTQHERALAKRAADNDIV